MKKILSVILAICLLLTIMPFGVFNLTASAEYTEYTEGYYTYAVSNGEATIIDVDTSISGNIAIPVTLGGYSVTSIGNYAFDSCDSIAKITIGNGVTRIGVSAFSWCESLTSITIPNSVTSIGARAFYWCESLTSITIPDSVTSIGDSAFSYCLYLTSAIIGEGVISIDDYTFSDCHSLTTVTIGNSVTTIGDYAFSDCESLISIAIPDSVASIGGYAFQYCSSLTGVTIGDGVTSIGYNAFAHCDSLTSITIPDGVTSIGDYAFFGCDSLTSATVGNSVTMIEESAFDCCYNLTKIFLPKDLILIKKNNFYGCSDLQDIYYGGSEEDWENISILSGNDDLLNATIHYNSTGIPKTNGYYTYIVSNGEAIITEVDTSICGAITIPDTLGGYSVTSIGESAFSWCTDLTWLTIPDSVISIGDFAFSYCGFEKVTIGDSVASIGYYAFSRCNALTNIEVSPDNDTYESVNGVLFDKGGKTLILCPGGKSGSYSIPNGVTSIGERAFEECFYLTSVTIPDSVTSIGDEAFLWCGLTKVTIPGSVTSIGDFLFSYSGLINVTIGNGVTSIGEWAFSDCYSLKKVTIPDSVTSIDDFAFVGCESLKDVYYGGSKEDWANISIGTTNNELLNATIHYAKTNKKPSAPKNLKATLYGHDDVKLSWSAASGATKYRIYYKKASAKSYNYKTTTSSLTYSISNLTDNCKYNFKIVPIAVYGKTTLTGTAKAITYSTTKDLAAPKTFKASLYGYDDAKLTWSAVSGASRYKIYYKQSSADTYKYKTYTTKTTYNFANLYDGVSYDFKIVPCSYVNSTHFEADSFKTVTISSTINISAPTTFKAELYGYDDVQLSWSAVKNAVAYKVYYKKSTAKSYTLKTTTTELTTKIWNLSDGIKYDFKVVPCTYVNDGYFADDSAKTASVYTLKKISTPTVTKHTSGKVKITWGNIQGETGYEISRSTSKTGTYIVSDYKTTTAKAKIVSATKGKTYYYKVRAYKIVDGQKIYSPWSAVKAYKLK